MNTIRRFFCSKKSLWLSNKWFFFFNLLFEDKQQWLQGVKTILNTLPEQNLFLTGFDVNAYNRLFIYYNLIANKSKSTQSCFQGFWLSQGID